MKITLVQSRGVIGDPKNNFYKARMRINNVDSDIFVFPELFCSGYTDKIDAKEVERIKNNTLSDIATLSKAKGSTVICGCPMDSNDNITNSAIILDGFEAIRYDKICLNKDGLFDDSSLFTAGNTPLIIERSDLKIGICIGHDLWSDALIRTYASNADIIICISALRPDEMDKHLKIAQATAAKYSIPIMLCNMTGNDPGVDMGGRSAFINADGTFIETCTTGSDVREIRIDQNALIEASKKRKIPDDVKIDDIKKYSITSIEADPTAAPKCPVFG